MKADTNLEKLLNQGEFVVTAELGPPQSVNIGLIEKKADLLRDYVDAVNITDNQTAVVRMSSLATSVIVKKNGLEPILQMTCRDRNRIAMQSDILGSAALGIANVLCISGDHQTLGNHPGSKNVFDVDSIQLVSILKNMRDEAIFQNGEAIKYPPKLFIGAAANPFADPFEYRVIRLAKKIKAGADFIQTQSIFDVERFERWMQEVRKKGLHQQVYIMAGVTPLKSYKAACFMSNVAGVTIPEAIMERIKNAKDQKAEGIEICLEIIKKIRKIEGVRGIHIMAVMWEDIVSMIVKESGLYPRPEIG
ncbi:MAG: methylenetetrahydrofolate reductase [Caldisericia bacterium]|nr:methylenetetrahydrofolate reductase [Caldisericia bacterium]MDD5689968.1 methylenetetrahydrofolate reductase [Caldisericia bacterium]